MPERTHGRRPVRLVSWLGEIRRGFRVSLVPLACVLAAAMLLSAGTGWANEPVAPVILRSAGMPSAPVLLKPGDELVWSVAPSPGMHSVGMSWKGQVAPDGTLDLGPRGSLKVTGLTLPQAKAAIDRQMGIVASPPAPVPGRPAGVAPAYVLKPNDVVNWKVAWHQSQPPQTLAGKGVVRRDGLLDLGPYGVVAVGGMTPPQVQAAIERRMAAHFHRAAQTPETANGGVVPVGFGGKTPQPLPQAPTLPTTDPANPPLPELPQPRSVPGPQATEPAANGSSLPMAPGHPIPGPGPPVTHECTRGPLQSYIIEPPDILLIESSLKLLPDQPKVAGQHLVRPDGTIGLGIYGSVYVAGLTLEQARAAVAEQLAKRVDDVDVKNISVDVLAYNSKVYYVITDGGGYGEQVFRLPITGNETVLDALSQINGLPPVASKKHIWVARPWCTPQGGQQQVLPVNWVAITQCGVPDTNYQVLPGDRIYVKADGWISFDARVQKVLAPFERMLGITLLGSETVNSIKGRTNGVP